MADQTAVVQELYNRLSTLPPDKAAIVSELAKRFGIGGADPGAAAAPDAGAQMRSRALSGVSAAMGSDSVPMAVQPYGGGPVVDVPTTDSLVDLPRRGARDMVSGSARVANAKTARDVAGGAHQVISGAMQIGSLTLPSAAVAAPIATAAGLAGGMAAGYGVTGGLKLAGTPDEYADLAGDVAGLAGGMASGHYGAQAGRAGVAKLRALADPANRPGFKVQLDPAEASAVAYGDREDVQIPTSVRTGSKVAADAEKIAQHFPLASGVAQEARAAEQSTLAAAGAREVSDLGAPGAGVPAPLEVGEAVHKKLDQTIAAHHAAGDAVLDAVGPAPGSKSPAPSPVDLGAAVRSKVAGNVGEHNAAASGAYDLLRQIEAQPQHATQVQVGTKEVPGLLDENGNATTKTVPVYASVQLPVALKPVKLALKPLYDRMLRTMPLTQQQSSQGLLALSNIVNGPDFESASIVDENLGAIKQLERETDQVKSNGIAKFAIQQLGRAVDVAVQRAGPDAVTALKQGRTSTIAKYGAQGVLDAMGKDEPAQLFNKLTAPGDRNLNFLRSVADQAPGHMPALAQSWTQRLADMTRSGDAAGAVDEWNRAGNQTKRILFPEMEGAPSKAGAVDSWLKRAADLQGVKGALPVADSLVARATVPGDRNVSLLRTVAAHAPEQMPRLAQSVVQGLIETGTAEAGMNKPQTVLRKWIDLGDETKNILFRDPYPHTEGGLRNVQRLTDFFTLMKKLGENPNPSGSGSLLSFVKGVGLILTAPHIGIPLLIAAKPAARLLFTPSGSRSLIAGLKTPATAKGAGLLAKDIIKAAGPGDVVPVQQAVAPAAAAPVSSESSATQNGGQTTGQTPAAPLEARAGATSGSEATAAGQQLAGVVGSRDTTVSIPGSTGGGYKAEYKLKELADVQPSHNGITFAPNPKYGLTNDRNYSNAVNQSKIVNGSSSIEFDPKYHVTDNPDPTNGPILTDSAGNVIGGNGRAMMLQRVNAHNPKGAAAYRALLESKAAQFGVDPAAVRAMKQPVLVREIPDSEFINRTKQAAVTDFNKKGTAELTPAERAIADSRRVSDKTLEDIASRLDDHGEDASLADILKGRNGGAVLEKLVGDGVISPQERAAFVGADGELTKAGKDRISQLVVGRFFRDPSQLEDMAPSTRNQVERIAPQLAQVEGKPDWTLTHHVQDALAMIEGARQLGLKNFDDYLQSRGLFGDQEHSPESVTLAKALLSAPAKALKGAARQYAGEAAFAARGNAMFGNAPTPAESFEETFGALLKAKTPAE